MKASELIAELGKLIEDFGDLDVFEHLDAGSNKALVAIPVLYRNGEHYKGQGAYVECDIDGNEMPALVFLMP